MRRLRCIRKKVTYTQVVCWHAEIGAALLSTYRFTCCLALYSYRYTASLGPGEFSAQNRPLMQFTEQRDERPYDFQIRQVLPVNHITMKFRVTIWVYRVGC